TFRRRGGRAVAPDGLVLLQPGLVELLLLLVVTGRPGPAPTGPGGGHPRSMGARAVCAPRAGTGPADTRAVRGVGATGDGADLSGVDRRAAFRADAEARTRGAGVHRAGAQAAEPADTRSGTDADRCRGRCRGRCTDATDRGGRRAGTCCAGLATTDTAGQRRLHATTVAGAADRSTRVDVVAAVAATGAGAADRSAGVGVVAAVAATGAGAAAR